MASLHVDAALIGSLIIILTFATREDLLNHRIPNVLVVLGLGIGILVQTSVRGWDGASFSLLGALVGLGGLLPFYLLRAMGAGDVKLMAAVGSFLGPMAAGLAVALTLIVGALLAIGFVVLRTLSRETPSGTTLASPLHWLVTWESARRERFPYALAIAVGTLLLVWQQGQLAQLAALVAPQ
jgi:prepilin peptidase CpaA